MSWNGNDLFNSTLMGGMPSGADPHQYLTTDGDGKPHWEDMLAYEDVQSIPVLIDAVVEPKSLGPNTNHDAEWQSGVSVGDKGVLYLDGVPYEYTAAESTAYGIWIKPDVGSVYPPVYMSTDAQTGEHYLTLISTSSTDTKFTVSITKTVTTLKTIDPKYLPSGSGGGGIIYVPNLTPDPSVINYCYKDNAGTSMLDFATGHEMMINGALLCYPSEETGNNYFHPGVFQVIPDANGIAAGIFIPETETFSMVMLGFSDTNA